MTKYKNIRTELDGISFDSRAEASRYAMLKLMQKAGEISALELQPRFKLAVNDQTVTTYVADFAYLDKQGVKVVEDVKSPATRGIAGFRLKAKLFRAIHGFDITIIEKGARA